MPVEMQTTFKLWLGRVLAIPGTPQLVGQVGILWGASGSSAQVQHVDHEEHHLVLLIRFTLLYTHTRIRVILASLRLCGHGSQTMFSGRPPPGQSPLDWYYGMFHMTVGRKDGLLFPCDVPHGQGRIPPDEDTWSFFATLHHQDTSPDGLDNSTLNHSTYIHRALTRPGESWEPRGVRYLLANPRILQQV